MQRSITIIFRFSLLVSLFLLIIKFIGWYMTLSDAVYASFIDSFSDSLISVVMLVTSMISSMPPTKNFPFGFDKIESTVILLEGILIVYSSILGIYYAVHNVLYDHAINTEELGIGIAIMLISIAVLSIYIFFVSRMNLNHELIKVNLLHYQSDLISNILIAINLVCSYIFRIHWIDKTVGIVCCLFILHKGTKIAYKALRNLLDMSAAVSIYNKIHMIVEIVSQEYQFRYTHIGVRESGSKICIIIHLQSLNDTIPMSNVIKMRTLLNQYIHSHYENAEITVDTTVGREGFEPTTNGL